jgi:hypothetical protein
MIDIAKWLSVSALFFAGLSCLSLWCLACKAKNPDDEDKENNQ